MVRWLEYHRQSIMFTYKKVEPAATKNSNKLSTTSSFQIWVLHFGIKLVYLSLNPRIFFVIYGRDNIPCLYFFYLDSRRGWEGRKHDQLFLDPPYTSKSSDPMPDWKIARFATSGRACMVNHCPQMMKWRPPLMGSLDPSLHHQLFGQSHYASLLSSLGSFIYLPKHQSMLELQYSMKLTKKRNQRKNVPKIKIYCVIHKSWI